MEPRFRARLEAQLQNAQRNVRIEEKMTGLQAPWHGKHGVEMNLQCFHVVSPCFLSVTFVRTVALCLRGPEKGVCLLLIVQLESSAEVLQDWMQLELEALERRLRNGLVEDLRPLLRRGRRGGCLGYSS